MRSPNTARQLTSLGVVGVLALSIGVMQPFAQVRSARRGAVAQGENATVAAGPRGAAVKTEDGYAAAGRRGAVVSGEEGYAAVGRHGNVVKGEDLDVDGAAVGRRGAVVVGEEGAAAVGRYGNVVVADRYESYDAWKAVAAVGVGIAIGTMLAKPPAAATTVVVESSTYYVHDNVYYTRVVTGGEVAYQVVAPPPGAIITTLPAGCTSVKVSGATYSQCGPTLLHEGVDGISGRRPEVTSEVVPTDARTHVAWRAALPVVLLLVVAGAQVTLARTAGAESLEGRRLRDVLDD